MPETIYGNWEGDPTITVVQSDGSATCHFHNGRSWFQTHPAEGLFKAKIMNKDTFMERFGHLLPIPENVEDLSDR